MPPNKHTTQSDYPENFQNKNQLYCIPLKDTKQKTCCTLSPFNTQSEKPAVLHIPLKHTKQKTCAF
ncbi:hypothetical protein PBAL39_13637 [Pedobacter sp. BAL39]|nr:hypothetical protein PBAL39_13637 [Pedobacter sp. BAL39]